MACAKVDENGGQIEPVLEASRGGSPTVVRASCVFLERSFST